MVEQQLVVSIIRKSWAGAPPASARVWFAQPHRPAEAARAITAPGPQFLQVFMADLSIRVDEPIVGSAGFVNSRPIGVSELCPQRKRGFARVVMV
jgi:hypothetical protein